MNKRLLALLTVCVLLISQIIAYADVIWSPDDNDFYERHEEECKYVGRTYYANGNNGFVAVKKAPSSNTEVSKIANGNTLLIQFTYDYNGVQWGVIPNYYDPSGWIPMNQLVLKYDYISFKEDHKDEFYEYKGNYDSLKKVDQIVLWSWPGSGEVRGILEEKPTNTYYTHSQTIEFLEKYCRNAQAYKDEQGREWVFVNRITSAYRDVWICITESGNTDIPAFNAVSEPEFITAKDNDFIDKSKTAAEQLDRRFYVKSPTGHVTPKEEPGSKKGVLINSYGKNEEELTYKNNDIVIISQTFLLNGEYWGVTSSGYAHPSPGWIPMDELLMLYERQDFEEEYENNLHAYTGSYDAVFAAKRHVLWQWPGSDREKIIIENDFVLSNIDTLYAYSDSEGREWGYVNLEYDHARVAGWICLTEPDNSDIPAFSPAPRPVKWSPDGDYNWVKDDADDVEQYSLSNITKERTYDKVFTDVSDNVWYKNSVVAAYEYGIIDGIGDGKFDPNGTQNGAEALAIAARIHARYKYGKVGADRLINEYNKSNRLWYDGTVSYCRSEGIIDDSEYEDYKFLEYPITRAQLINAWSKILQSKDMEKQNTVKSLPDVSSDTDYSADIFAFYEAGILSGIDDKGTFNPNGNITRAEAATIFMNLIEVNKRHIGKTYGS